jgi:hypothetical protein
MLNCDGDTSGSAAAERVQPGIRTEKRLVRVINGRAEFDDVTLGQLPGKTVLHSSGPAAGAERKRAASPHGERALAAVTGLKRVCGPDDEKHGYREFTEDGTSGE